MPGFDLYALQAFARRLEIPPPALHLCVQAAAQLDAEVFEPLIAAVLVPAQAELAQQQIQALCAPVAENGMAELAVLLTAAHRAQKSFSAQGISKRVYWDTMGCFGRFITESYRRTGLWCFDRGFWVWRQLCARLVRLGTLEFEALPLPEAYASALKASPGCSAVAVHIPSNAVCTTQELHASYAQCANFFSRGGGQRPLIYCHSWLLSPTLTPFLAESSGIRAFAQDYRILQFDSQNNEGKLWLFGSFDIPNSQLPQSTSLQRAVKQLLCSGSCVGAGLGILQLDQLEADV